MNSFEIQETEKTEFSSTPKTTHIRTKKVLIIVMTSLVVVGVAVGLAVGFLVHTPVTSTSNQNPDSHEEKIIDTYPDHQVGVINNCSFTIWVGVLGNPNLGIPLNGGWELPSQNETNITFAHGWNGRLWGRTNCDQWGWCQTGDCGGKIECNGTGGVPPVTLAEFSFDTPGGDYYDISIVDGYNVPMGIIPLNATRSPFGGDWRYHCQFAGCNTGEDLNDICPPELQVKNSSGAVIACLSACQKFGEDQFCCTGNYSTPQTCPPTTYSNLFKEVCPEAYTYAYDDSSALYTCDGIPVSNYDVIFCP